MEIEFTIEKNVDQLLRLNESVHNLHYAAHTDRFSPFNRSLFRPWFEKFLQQDQVICVFVKEGMEYIGYALLIHKKSHSSNPFSNAEFESLYIDQMSIEKEYQNLGVGKRLIDFVKKLAAEKGIPKVQLDVWSDNLVAKAFYLKNGFSTYREIMEADVQ